MLFDDFITKLSPKKGDLLVFTVRNQHDVDSLGRCQDVFNQLANAAKNGYFDKNIPVVIAYGNDAVECISGNKIGHLMKSYTDGAFYFITGEKSDFGTVQATIYVDCLGRVYAVSADIRESVEAVC